MAQSRRFSNAQLGYLAARAVFNIAYQNSRDYDQKTDRECERLGSSTPYGILPEGHPMLVEAQRLLDLENDARRAMYTSAFALFDWATETTLAKCGTATQKAAIRRMVAKVKTMAHVEQAFAEFVDASLKLSL